MSKSPPSIQPNLIPPITYTTQRIDPKNNAVHSQQPISSNNVIIVYQDLKLGPDPMLITCPNCSKTMTTDVDYRVGDKTHSCAFLLCCLGCDSCALIPYCMDSMKDALHYCSNCRTYLGKHCPS